MSRPLRVAAASGVALVVAVPGSARQAGPGDATPYGLVALLLLVLGVHAAFLLSARIRSRLERQGQVSRRGLVVDASRLGCLWGIAPVVAAVIAVGAIEESEGMGAAGALLAILGSFAFAVYGFTLGFGTLFAFSRLRPDAPGAPWLLHALVTGLVVGGVASLLCSGPWLLLGAELPRGTLLLASSVGLALFSAAVASGVFWRARSPRPREPTSRIAGSGSGLLRRSGIQLVLVLGVVWALAIPMSAVRLYGWVEPGALKPFNPALEAWGLPIWLVPGALLAGAWLGGELARRFALGVFLVAVLIQGLHLIGGVWTSDVFTSGGAVLVMLVFTWPLWYLSRAEVRQAYRR